MVLNGKKVPHLTESVPFLWTGKRNGQIPAGYTGNGQPVAILDTGIRTDHPAFLALRAATGGIPAKAFLSHTEFEDGNRLKPNHCFADNSATSEDMQGHGTHVAGIVASRAGKKLNQADWTGYK